MEFILVIVGVLVGGGVVWWLNRSVGSVRESDLLRRAESAEAEVAGLRDENKELSR